MLDGDYCCSCGAVVSRRDDALRASLTMSGCSRWAVLCRGCVRLFTGGELVPGVGDWLVAVVVERWMERRSRLDGLRAEVSVALAGTGGAVASRTRVEPLP